MPTAAATMVVGVDGFGRPALGRASAATVVLPTPGSPIEDEVTHGYSGRAADDVEPRLAM